MKRNLLLLWTGVLFLLAGCEKEDAASQMKFKFADPQAILLKGKEGTMAANGRIAYTTQSDDKTTLFQIDKAGKVSAVVEDVEIISVSAFSYGLIIKLNDGAAYCVFLDNSYLKLPSSIGDLKGENENGDLVFSDVSILRKSTKAFEKLQTTLTQPHVQSVSGNFAVIRGGNIYQVFNTVSNERFNVNGCNGPRITALNKEKALINDCGVNALMDMKSGERTPADVQSWNQEDLYTGNGAILLDQSIAWKAGITGDDWYGLGFVDASGKLRILSQDGFKPGSGACMNCGNKNTVLFASGDYVIVRELNKVSVVKKGSLAKTSILSGYNVSSVSVKDSKIYFIAEDKYGKRIAGIYTLSDGTTQLLNTQEEFEKVFTL